jgi:hypothetical protein
MPNQEALCAPPASSSDQHSIQGMLNFLKNKNWGAFSPDSRFLMVLRVDGRMRVYSFDTHTLLQSLGERVVTPKKPNFWSLHPAHRT